MIRNLLAGLLVAAYAFALVMSTGHLAEWYKLTLGGLPGWFAVGLAAALETSAFLLSLLSNSLLRGSAWASWGSVVALGLVWVGNYFSMSRAGVRTGIPGYEVFLSSMFVPVSTYVVAKVLGELLSGFPNRETRVETVPKPRVETVVSNPTSKVSDPTPRVSDLEPEFTGVEVSEVYEAERRERVVYARRGRGDEEFIRLLQVPRSTREVAETLGISRPGALKRLRALEARGLVRNTEAGWLAVKEG